MKITSKNDKSFVRLLITPYVFDRLLVDISNKDEEIGLYFYAVFYDLKYHPIVFKHEGVWCINVNSEIIPDKIKNDETLLNNAYERMYLDVLQRINFIQRLSNEHLIFSTSDTQKCYIPNIDKLLPFARKIEDKNLCRILDDYERVKLYPTDELLGMLTNKFRTTDEIHFSKQYYISIFAVLVAVILPIVLNKCTSTSIDEQQMTRIVSAINSEQRVVEDLKDSLSLLKIEFQKREKVDSIKKK